MNAAAGLVLFLCCCFSVARTTAWTPTAAMSSSSSSSFSSSSSMRKKRTRSAAGGMVHVLMSPAAVSPRTAVQLQLVPTASDTASPPPTASPTTTTTAGPEQLLQAPAVVLEEDDDDDNDTVDRDDAAEMAAWTLPPITSAAALFWYDDTRKIFHSLIDVASGQTWAAADGGKYRKYMADLIRPVLNGPVTLSISVLFGTLVAMTVQTLFNRQITIHKTLVGSVEEVRDLSLFADGFPEPYRGRGQRLLERFVDSSLRDFRERTISPESLRKKETTSLLLVLNALGADATACPAYMGEAYASLQRLKALRCELTSTLQTVFSPAHYVNILTLAGTLLFVFLLETDQDAMQFLVGFQLSICWAMLIGSFTMLGVVIYDLATPFSGVFAVLRGTASDLERVRGYALALDERAADVAGCDSNAGPTG